MLWCVATVRGRYDIKIYPTFLQLHGKTFDYKIAFTSILRLFLLPHRDNRQMFFVVSDCAMVILLYLNFGVSSVSYPLLRPYLFSPVCSPNVTIGHNSLFVVLVNRRKDRGFILLNSSSLSCCDPKLEYLSCILAGHPRKWNAVSSSSPHAADSGSVHRFITLGCLLSAYWAVNCREHVGLWIAVLPRLLFALQ